jgi:hypothetical protein
MHRVERNPAGADVCLVIQFLISQTRSERKNTKEILPTEGNKTLRSAYLQLFTANLLLKSVIFIATNIHNSGSISGQIT